ncbi:hypothetical protein NECAME_09060 [Necator americanus]|uniref:SCP domain-containing protein n=1 Tax=Necator americanus TaxID=51031 RepID=W2THY1_NECAM|nr:hypothetical protein NECAME_09060 [Necator americanus]ETN80637.1 hypothetical protein NECAME_09060 [Necator americanus]
MRSAAAVFLEVSLLILLTTSVTGDTRNERTCTFPNALDNDLRDAMFYGLLFLKPWKEDPKYACQIEQDIHDNFDKFNWKQYEGNSLDILTFMYHEKNSFGFGLQHSPFVCFLLNNVLKIIFSSAVRANRSQIKPVTYLGCYVKEKDGKNRIVCKFQHV